MHLNFDYLIVLENLCRGILITDTQLKGPNGPRILYVNRAWMKMTGYDREDIRGKTPRMLQGKHTDRRVVSELTVKMLNREIFHGQTWNYRRNGEPFMMNWYCYAIYGERGKPIYYVAEQEDITAIEKLRNREILQRDPTNAAALAFFAVLDEYKQNKKKALMP